MGIRMRGAAGSRQAMSVAALVVVATWWLFPLIATFVASLNAPEQLQRDPANLALFQFSTANFKQLIDGEFPRWALNSAIVALASTVTALAISVPLGYAAGLLRLKAARVFIRLMLLAYVIPPSFLVFAIVSAAARIGLIGSTGFVGVVVGALASPICSWLMERQFLLVPRQLFELSLLDGLSNWSIVRRVLVPVLAPSFLVVAAFAFISGWGDYTLSLSLLPFDAGKTISIGVVQFLMGDIWRWGDLFASICLASIPPIIVGIVALSSSVLLGRGRAKG